MIFEVQSKTESRLARENSRLCQQNQGLRWALLGLLILLGVLYLHAMGIDIFKSTPECQNVSSNGCL